MSTQELAGNAGNAESLIAWFNDGADGAINWGEPGDFAACVEIAGKHMDSPEGFCQNRHIDATGEPAGKGAHSASAVELAGRRCKSCGGGVGDDVKTCQNCGASLTASVEERITTLEVAVVALASVELGSPDQERDDHGRWASGADYIAEKSPDSPNQWHARHIPTGQSVGGKTFKTRREAADAARADIDARNEKLKKKG